MPSKLKIKYSYPLINEVFMYVMFYKEYDYFRETLSVHFHEVYFLPDIPELAVANDILKQYTEGSSR